MNYNDGTDLVDIIERTPDCTSSIHNVTSTNQSKVKQSKKQNVPEYSGQLELEWSEKLTA